VVGYLPELVSAYINSEFGREWVRSVVSQQVGQPNVNDTKLRELGVPPLPLSEQKELWVRIDRAFAGIDKVVAETSRATDLLDRLDQAAFEKAFRGELVTSQRNGRLLKMANHSCSVEVKIDFLGKITCAKPIQAVAELI
jgi:type I restriction enzyme, S subunit